MSFHVVVNGGSGGFGVPGPIVDIGRAVLGGIVGAVATQAERGAFRRGADIQIESNAEAEARRCNNGFDKRFRIDPCSGQLVEVKKRRRRRRLLTCGDKADIAFVTGTLGKGQTGAAAISTLLARCN